MPNMILKAYAVLFSVVFSCGTADKKTTSNNNRMSMMRRQQSSQIGRHTDQPNPSGLNVALAVIVPYGVVGHYAPEWQDAFAVLAHSARQAMANSKRIRKIEYIALVPEEVVVDDAARVAERDALMYLGFTPRFVPIPVRLEEIRNPIGREALSKVLGDKEQLKYYGAALTDYDRVLVLDGDTMLLDHIDDLLDLSPRPGMVGTYDHEMDLSVSVFPPVNSGFLLFTPDKADFDGLVEVYREGDLSDRGFRKSGTGWTYGAGSQGILSFFYNQWESGNPGFKLSQPTKGKDLPGLPATLQPSNSRFHPVDRSVYDVIQTDSLRRALAVGNTTIERVKVFHFAGECMKPWTCTPTRTDLCETMTKRWWTMRREVETAYGLAHKDRCAEWGHYDPMYVLNATNTGSRSSDTGVLLASASVHKGSAIVQVAEDASFS